MHGLFVVCLFGGALATALFAVLGRVGGVGHGGHLHLGHQAHGGGGHALPGHGHAGTAGHGASGHAEPAGHASAAHGASGHAGHGQGLAAKGHAPAPRAAGSDSAQPTPAVPTGHDWLSSSAGWTLSWISPLTLAAAALWFGAAGLLTEALGATVALLLAIVAAVLGAALVRGLMAAFVRASTPPLRLTGEGALATVNVTIRPDAPGEVIYTLEGLHRSVPARSEEGHLIPRGTTVVVLRREKGFAWVTPLDPLAELESGIELPVERDDVSRPDGRDQLQDDTADAGG